MQVVLEPALLRTLAGLLLMPAGALARMAFSPADPVSLDQPPELMALGDLNSDRRADVVLVYPNAGEIGIYLASDAAVAGFVPAGTMRFGSVLRQAAVGELDGDGAGDLACVDQRARGVWILLGRGDGTFLDPYLARVAEAAPHAIALADLDGARGDDLLVGDKASRHVGVYMNDGATPPTFRRSPPIMVGGQPSVVLALDVNRDGRPDVVTLDTESPGIDLVTVHLLERVVQGIPDFDDGQAYRIGERATHLVAADLITDGAPDLAVLDRATGPSRLTVLRNDDNGRFDRFAPSVTEVPCPFFTGGAPCRALGLAAADVNRDNHTDLAVALNDPRNRDTSSTPGDALQILAGRGDGRFGWGPVFAIGKSPAALASSYVTGDCLPDVLVTTRRPPALQVLVNASKPGFSGNSNGESCLLSDECLSGRCTNGYCCATACAAGERCDVTGAEGVCRPLPPSIIACGSHGDCPTAGQPFCADGICCDFPCSNGRCDYRGFEGLCIPGLGVGEPCTQDHECATGFCSDNLRCCRERCADGFCDEWGVCHLPRELTEPCAADAECRSGVCDVYQLICCSRRCDVRGEVCNPATGECGYLSGAETPATFERETISTSRRSRGAGLTTCRADCDGDDAVSIAEVVRLVAAALGSGEVPQCPAAALAAPSCVSIGDVVQAVNQALAGCP